jgi:hypothetical protein
MPTPGYSAAVAEVRRLGDGGTQSSPVWSNHIDRS